MQKTASKTNERSVHCTASTGRFLSAPLHQKRTTKKAARISGAIQINIRMPETTLVVRRAMNVPMALSPERKMPIVIM